MKRFPNDKPWFDRSVRTELFAKEQAFRSGDAPAIKKAKYAVQKAIRNAKLRFRNKLEDDISATNSRELWKGFHKITGYKPKPKQAPQDDTTLPDQLNDFFTRFDRPKDRLPDMSETLPPPFEITLTDTRRVLRQLKLNKAPGPDGITPRLLRSCNDFLCNFLCKLFNWSLKTCHVPNVF